MHNIQFEINLNKITYTNVGDYHLADTFECGQAFRFDPHNGGYRGFVEKQLCHITLQDKNGNVVPSVTDGDGGTLIVEVIHTTPTADLAQKIGESIVSRSSSFP